MAHLLQLLDRSEEAIQKKQQLGCRPAKTVRWRFQLYSMLADTQQWPAAEQALERYATLSPLLEPAARRWLPKPARRYYQLGKRTDKALLNMPEN